MSRCATYGPQCYAVAFSEEKNTCQFFKDVSDINFVGASGSDDTLYNLAVADKSQLPPTSGPPYGECPYSNKSIQTTSLGEEFSILCNIDLGVYAGDYCADNYSSEDYKCTPHADTMEECLEICSKAHPLCKGVTFGNGKVRSSNP